VKTPRPAREAQSRAAAPVTAEAPLPDGVPGAVVRSARRASERAERRVVVDAQRYSLKPMTVDEAALELEGQKTRFLVFREAGTDAVNVLYRRDDGRLALIEPEV
jgi:putative sigma-54 modulation protein